MNLEIIIGVGLGVQCIIGWIGWWFLARRLEAQTVVLRALREELTARETRLIIEMRRVAHHLNEMKRVRGAR